MQQVKERKLKVYNQSRNGYSNIPTILLKGHWLKEFNFNINDNVIIVCKENEIVIKKLCFLEK